MSQFEVPIRVLGQPFGARVLSLFSVAMPSALQVSIHRKVPYTILDDQNRIYRLDKGESDMTSAVPPPRHRDLQVFVWS